MKGYAGKFLFVDLTKKVVQHKSLDWQIARDFIGGCGYAARLLYNRLNLENLDPFHPQNEMAIFTGPLTATGAPCTGRHAICTKSALTGIWGESTGGGYFGAELRFAGLDGILITGASREPVYLEIHDEISKIRPADHLWGKGTFETEEIIKRDAGDQKLRVLSIGLAGEKLVRFAAVMNDAGRASARAGAGAVFGAKKLKAIAVRGTTKPAVANPEQFKEQVKLAFQQVEGLKPILGENGTVYAIDLLMNLFNDMPVRFFTEPSMSVEKINAKAFQTIRSGKFSCHLCPIGCGPIITLETDSVHLKNVAGPEYETVAALGTLCQVDDLQLLCQANHLCNIYGIDTISCGNIIAFAFAMNELGKIPDNLKGSLSLEFGNGKTMIQLIEMITQRKGLGDLLAEGSRRASEYLDVPQMALHVKGLEVPMHDPRAFFGFAATYATSPIGAHHMQGDICTVNMGISYPEFDIEPLDRHTDEGKGIQVAKFQSWRTIFNSLVLCQLTMLEPNLVAALYTEATGQQIDPSHLLEIGHRTMTIKRAFNIRCGITAKDDALPPSLMKAFATGTNAGKAPDLAKQLDDYYQYRQWDPVTGKPTRKCLESMGLSDVVNRLWQ
ncbi:MAG: aldehyde ferredoxin oxidoreductase family protein [Promethearchaeota archaeon]